jgi:hypothetical protein
MSTPSVPDHHAHAMVRNVKCAETMQMVRNDSSFEQEVAATHHKISMTINAEPNQLSQFRVHS